ncbi:MAG: hypothetical protein ABSB22_16745 [Thermodesulfobacteriota bacterium]|jgi:DnaJ-class molecular chaperone
MDKIFDPGKYGMVICPLCKGKGKVLEDPDGFSICRRCGGFGLIKKDEEPPGSKISVSIPASIYEEE